MNTLKLWLFIGFIVFFMAFVIQRQHNQLKTQEKELVAIKKQLDQEKNESRLKLAAFEEREKELLQDRKEIENVYNELAKTKQSCKIYAAWGDVYLPDSVSKLVREQ